MPGTSNRPTRPRRLISLSRERRRYSSGTGIFAFLFGLGFTSSGIFVLATCGLILRDLLAGLPPLGDQLTGRESLLGVLVLLVLGTVHLLLGIFLLGSVLLGTLRTTVDRARDLITVRSGLLGWRCQRRRLSEFRAVTILPGSPPFPGRRLWGALGDESWFDVALADQRGDNLVIGRVSRSFDLAQTVADEISQFTHLPSKMA